jgi:biopolymer transport protein ExbD
MRLSKIRGLEAPWLDSTPVIDLALLLVLFFALALHLSRRELEPRATPNAPDQVDAQRASDVLDVLVDGRVLAGDELLYDPTNDDGYAALQRFLARTAPADRTRAILLRADRSAPFEFVRNVMQACDREHVAVGRIQLGSVAAPAGGGR